MKKNFWLFTTVGVEDPTPKEVVYRTDDLLLTTLDLKSVKNFGGREGVIISSVYLGFMTEEEFNGQG